MQLKHFYNIATKVSSIKKCYYFWFSNRLLSFEHQQSIIFCHSCCHGCRCQCRHFSQHKGFIFLKLQIFGIHTLYLPCAVVVCDDVPWTYMYYVWILYFYLASCVVVDILKIYILKKREIKKNVKETKEWIKSKWYGETWSDAGGCERAEKVYTHDYFPCLYMYFASSIENKIWNVWKSCHRFPGAIYT